MVIYPKLNNFMGRITCFFFQMVIYPKLDNFMERKSMFFLSSGHLSQGVSFNTSCTNACPGKMQPTSLFASIANLKKQLALHCWFTSSVHCMVCVCQHVPSPKEGFIIGPIGVVVSLFISKTPGKTH